MTTFTQIQTFLGTKRLAVVGVSSNPADFSRSLFSELQARGYDVVPVNPGVDKVLGLRCYAHVGEIDPAVDGALLMTGPAVTEQVVRECHAAGVRSVWMYRGATAGAVSPEAVKYCEDNGMSVVAGECPFMFLPETPWFHRFHGFCRKLTGRYPK